ncbi:beta-galactosidase [Celeribacter arenosi]|uniref:Beta-galactosidase n=1 Tax=Celeribacter arenosi TaxID=792649 RepID=A0ABP7KCU3_9RHOB
MTHVGLPRALGTCYYPEHWPQERWEADARMMAESGLTWVRIGEFAWSRLEPRPGDLQLDWLEKAIEILNEAGLKVVLGTPTATPPRWVVDKHPDMLAVDEQGRPRAFGSRRHYCFSHEGYIEESRRITAILAKRFGASVAAWQTDNEYGCHDTTVSYSDAACRAFQRWLEARYGDIEALNEAWGNVFWSMEYNRFDQIGLPNLTVTDPNPAHALAFRRFSSDQVREFNRVQLEEIRKYSKAPISHNYMGQVTDFDHYALGADMEIATWDSYPLGFLEDRVVAAPEYKQAFARQGDADFQAFHHDLYRAVGRGRWWIMEQQPGPVNWAPHNPAPLPGMVRLWSWEAFAHGAEAVCYFRWRQAPFAQEQMHSGLLRPDSSEAEGLREVRQVANELASAPKVEGNVADVALVFDYDAEWAWAVQPHGQGLSYFGLVLAQYRALRRAGLNIDIVGPSTRDFSDYKAVFAPGLMHLPDDLRTALEEAKCVVVLGPRTAARTIDFEIPTPLPPSLDALQVTVTRVQSLRSDCPVALEGGGNAVGYLETIASEHEPVLEDSAGAPVAVQNGNLMYCAAWLDDEGWDRLISIVAAQVDMVTRSLPVGVRVRRTQSQEFWFNYNAHAVQTEAGEIEPASLIMRTL